MSDDDRPESHWGSAEPSEPRSALSGPVRSASQEPSTAPSRPTGDSGVDRDRGLIDNKVARVVALVVFVGLIVAGAVTGVVGWPFAVLVLAPVAVSMILAEADRTRGSSWARVATVLGLMLWLAFTGGLPMLLVVTTVVLMIFLHELGHYIAAKRAGLKVTEFFLGFGSKLWSFRRGETEFGLKAIPAGAYVKIIGMNNLEEVDPADEPRTYRQAPFRSRLSVAAAGSAMHFALALVLLVVQFAAFGRVDEQSWTAADLTSGGAAEQAGLLDGDRVITFAGEPVGTFEDFRDQIRSVSGTVPVVIERDGERRTLDVDLIRRGKVIGTVGTDVDVLEGPDGLRIGPLVDNGRGERAGLETGQQVVAVNGTAVGDLDDLAGAVDSTEGGRVAFEVADGPAVGTEDVVVDLGSAVDTTSPTAFLGVGVEHDLRREPLYRAAGSSIAEFGRGVGASVVGIATVFSPPRLMSFLSSTLTGADQDVTEQPTPAEDVAVSSDAGRPISIIGAVAYGADLTAQNLSNLIGFLIALNIFIGVFNLIPLLPFDGGHVAIAVYEKARELRRRTHKRYIADITRMIPVAYGVVMVLAVVGILTMYLDLTLGVSA